MQAFFGEKIMEKMFLRLISSLALLCIFQAGLQGMLGTVEAQNFAPGGGDLSGHLLFFERTSIVELEQSNTNPDDNCDVNGNGEQSALDALLIINYINQNGDPSAPPTSGPPYLDVNGDGEISTEDATAVLDALNGNGCEAPEEDYPEYEEFQEVLEPLE